MTQKNNEDGQSGVNETVIDENGKIVSLMTSPKIDMSQVKTGASRHFDREGNLHQDSIHPGSLPIMS